MKQNFRTLQKTSLYFLFLFTLLLSSCQKDDFTPENKEKDYKFSSITLKQVENYSSKASILFTKTVNKTSQLNRVSSSTEIDSSRVIYLERANGFKSFTYRLKDDLAENYFNNIVIYEFPDGSTKAFSVKYMLNKSLLQATQQSNLKTSIIGYQTSVLNTQNTNNRTGGYSCVSIGYWAEVDKCEGQLVTPEENPGCFESDGTTRAKKVVFITIDEDCSFSGGEGGNGSGGIFVGGTPTNFEQGGGGNGDLSSIGGIFIPNPYEFGEEDPNNPDFMLSSQVSQYLNTIPSWNSIINQANTYGGLGTFWMQPFFVNFIKNNGELNTQNKNLVKSVIDRFNQVYNNGNSQKMYENSQEKNLINYKLFQTFLSYPTLSAQIIQSVFIYRDQNLWSQECVEYSEQLMDYCVEENTPEATQEITDILDILDDGLIDGQPVVVGPDTPITNMGDYLSCFNTSQPATLTIYADQPVTGKHNLVSGLDVGHAFISIKQGNNVKTLGFYPISTVESGLPNPATIDPNDFISTPGVFGNDQGHTYDVSLTVNVNSTQLTNIVNGITNVANSNPQYNLGNINCTDLAILIFNNNTQVDVPTCESPYILWDGQTPGTLGEVLNNLPTPPGAVKDTNGGTAPINNPN